eukprot:g13242.t1
MLGRWSWREIAGVPAPSEPTESKVQMRRRPRRDYEREQASMLAKRHRQNGGGQSQEEETQEGLERRETESAALFLPGEPLDELLARQSPVWCRATGSSPTKHVRRAALLARVTARSSALAGLDDLDRKKREVALAAERFKNDKEVVLAAVANSGQALKYVGKALQSDRDVVSAAIQQNGLALHFASPRMRCDKELVLEACERDGSALLFAADGVLLQHRSENEVLKCEFKRRF